MRKKVINQTWKDGKLSHPWRDELESSINKIVNKIRWRPTISEEKKKWIIEEIRAQQKVILTLKYREDLDYDNVNGIRQKDHRENMLIKGFSIVVDWKYGYLSQKREYEESHKGYFHEPEYGFYSKIIPFIEYQLINFVKKNGKLKFGILESLNYNAKDVSIRSLFKDESKFDKILEALVEKGIAVVDNDGNYGWIGKNYAERQKNYSAPGLQLVALYLTIKPLLASSNLSGAKASRLLNELFHCAFTERLFTADNRLNAEKYKSIFTFINHIG
ncbi:MAG TPA: hypothetical protein VIY08_11325 [Candidatus Nitrosocosmicus sp.]